MRSQNVGIFIMNNSLSGAEKRFIRIANEIQKFKKNVILITNNEIYELAKKDSELKSVIKNLDYEGQLEIIKSKPESNKFFRTIKNLFNLISIIKNRDIEVLHCSLGALKYSFIKKIVDVRIIAEITSPDIAQELLDTKKYKRVVRYFDEIITVSDGVYDKTIKSLSELDMKDYFSRVFCSRIPFFLPNQTYGKYKIENKENLIVFASRFIDRKNPVLFAKAVKKFLSENKNWKVAILGKGPLESYIKEILDDNIKEGTVTVKHTKNLYGYLSKSKIFVSLIQPDNYPSQSILEAMYMKNTIIATNVGNTDKLVTKDNGFLINYFEVDYVVEALKKAVADQNTLNKFGSKSKEIVLKEFSNEIYLKDLINIYNKY